MKVFLFGPCGEGNILQPLLSMLWTCVPKKALSGSYVPTSGRFVFLGLFSFGSYRLSYIFTNGALICVSLSAREQSYFANGVYALWNSASIVGDSRFEVLFGTPWMRLSVSLKVGECVPRGGMALRFSVFITCSDTVMRGLLF